MIYAKGDDYTHVARQLFDGRWTSKLGSGEDITHDSPEDILCDDYGDIVHFMKRPME